MLWKNRISIEFLTMLEKSIFVALPFSVEDLKSQDRHQNTCLFYTDNVAIVPPVRRFSFLFEEFCSTYDNFLVSIKLVHLKIFLLGTFPSSSLRKLKKRKFVRPGNRMFFSIEISLISFGCFAIGKN